MKIIKKTIPLILIMILVGAGAFYFLFDTATTTEEEQIEKKMPAEYGYTLRPESSQLQKDIYLEMVELLNQEQIDYLEFAGLVSKSFVADYFTWTNKSGRQDVGGLQFIANGYGENFRLYSMDNYYEHLSEYLLEYDKDELPVVDTITITTLDYAVFRGLDGSIINEDAYYCVVEWTYIENLENPSTFDMSELPTRLAFTLVVEDGKVNIATFN